MSSALPGSTMFVLCLDDAAQANLQCLARTHDGFLRGTSSFNSEYFLSFLKSSSGGISRKKENKQANKQKMSMLYPQMN